MSSFIGIVNGKKELIAKVQLVAENTEFVIQNDFCTVFSTTASDRLKIENRSDSAFNWIISGIGIHPYPNTKLVSQNDWSHLVLDTGYIAQKLNGHFAGVIIGLDQVELITDQVGMRSLFVLKHGDAFIFSTRIDWLLPFSNREINWEIFGEHWLSINSFSSDLFIPDIERIHSGANCLIDQKDLHHQPRSWIPKKTEIELEHYLKDLCTTLFLEKNQLSLGLSGGLDSRLLLSVLSGNPEIEFDLYTFSGIKHPDEEVARNLSNLVRKPHQLLNYSWENFSLDELSTQTSRSMLNSTIPHVLFNQLYAKLGAENVYSIDGGIGEIGRRRYLRGLQLRAEKAIQSRDISALAPFFNSPKADIFNNEINQQMKLGFHQRLEYAINSMPTFPTIGNWLDLFSIRTRLLNIAGLNQEHVDSTHFHIMPFVQPDFLNAILSLPESERLNAKWYRKLIKKHLPSSSKLPLVKTDDVYPFWMKDISSQVWIKLQKRFRKTHQNPLLVNVFLSNESQIRDILSLSSLHQIDFYDPQKVNYLVHSFYDNNNYQLAASLNWFLTFELFRKKLAHESI